MEAKFDDECHLTVLLEFLFGLIKSASEHRHIFAYFAGQELSYLLKRTWVDKF